MTQPPSMTVQHALQLGFGHHQAGRFAQAEALYRQVLAAQPDYAEALHLLGLLARDVGRSDVAEQLIGRAIGVNPASAEYHSNLSAVLRDLGKLDQAVVAARRAIELDPTYALAHNNLGSAFHNQGELDQAVAAYARAIELQPDLAGVHFNLGVTFKERGEIDRAVESYRRAMALNRDDPAPHSALLHALYFLPDCDQRAILEEHARWNAKFAEPLARQIHPHDNDRDPDRRLRVGYVSADLRNHPVGRFLRALLAHHDHDRIEIFCYADVHKPDATTESLRRCADSWRDISGLKHSQVAELIRRDRIDILIDLGLHTEGNRLLVFARRPAPVQATYLAYPGTSGLTSIDFRITDPYLDPPGASDEFHAEKSIRVSESYWCYDPPSFELAPARKSGRFTFGCLNNFCKVSPDCQRVWARILLEMPAAQLFLHAGEGSHRQRVIEMLANHGVADAPARVRFVGFVPTEEYFKVYHSIDVALDPFPYNGGTTTCDALWMGVQVVNLAGKTAVARAGLSLLSNAGVPELVAGSEDEYVKIALTLAGDPKRLGEFREALRARMQASKLMDGARFARDMEEAYRGMWKSWVAG